MCYGAVFYVDELIMSLFLQVKEWLLQFSPSLSRCINVVGSVS
jgi:hypothetical protein